MHDPLTQKKWIRWLSSKLKLLFCGRRSSIWEKIVSIHADPISRIHKEHVKLNSKKTNIPIRQWAEGLSRYFNEDCRDGKSAHEKILNTLSYLMFSGSVVSSPSQPHGLQHTRLPGLSLSLGFAQTHAHQVSGAINQLILCHLVSSCLQSFPAS